MDITSTVTLNNGVEMPCLGLGVWQAGAGDETRQAVLWALEAGYRHIDTARIYGNEREVGQAVRDSGIPRDQVFVTTKLWNGDHGYDKARRALQDSLRRLGFEYVDLYLIHWPVEGKRGESWRALVQAQADGLARAVGVSNYQERHLDELVRESDVVPAVDQVEFSPFLYQEGLLEHCRRLGVRLEAYSPLTRGRRLDEPVLVETAARHGATPAQVLIRWALQHATVVIPKSVHRERIRENADVFGFELSGEEMAALDSLHRDRHETWDPTNVA